MGRNDAVKKIIIIIAAVLLVGGGVAYFMFLKPAPEPETSYYSPGESFVTNIKDSTRLLKATVSLEILSTETEEVAEELAENNDVIRDIIVFTLRGKTEDELRSMGIEEDLRKELQKNISEKMEIDYLQKVYFNDFVIQ
jgi:flagellar basal body-associated protein FliL